MRSLAEHRAAVLALVAPLPASTVPVGSALGLVLAHDVVAAVDLPGFDNSAMDGYAVRAAELAGAGADSPVVLPVAGDVAAGDTTRHVLDPGQVLRIMTGAPVPEGADAVVPVEQTDGGATEVALRLAPRAGASLRHRGEDVRTGDRVLPAGTRLGPGHLALSRGGQRARAGGAPAPAGAGGLHRRRAGPRGVRPRARPDRRLQLRDAVRARRGGRRRGRRVGPPARRRRHDARPARRPAGRARPGAHHRWGVDGGLRHGQGGAHRRRWRRVRQGGHATRDAAGLRRRRPLAHPRGHAARQPGQLLRVLPRLRAARAAAAGGARPRRRRRVRGRRRRRGGRPLPARSS